MPVQSTALRLLSLALATLTFVPCLADARADASKPWLRLTGITQLSSDASPDEMVFGGISGIDYDPKTGLWLLESDDKSEFGPSRYWSANIAIHADQGPTVALSSAKFLLTERGNPFPAMGTGAEASDTESIRFDPLSGRPVWSSEGDARDGYGPAIRTLDATGTRSVSVTLPPMFRYDPAHREGPRPNLSIEGMSFTDQGHALWFSMEAPLFQDGPVASQIAGADVRFTRLEWPRSAHWQQFTYRLEPIGPVASGRLADNGVSEILAIDDRHFFVIERSGVQQPDGGFHFRPRLYCASLDQATDVAALMRLAGANYRTMAKRIIFDFTTVRSLRVDNVEGVSWGPRLGNGDRTLVFVTDNNFQAKQPTQILSFALRGASISATIRALCP